MINLMESVFHKLPVDLQNELTDRGILYKEVWDLSSLEFICLSINVSKWKRGEAGWLSLGRLCLIEGWIDEGWVDDEWVPEQAYGRSILEKKWLEVLHVKEEGKDEVSVLILNSLDDGDQADLMVALHEWQSSIRGYFGRAFRTRRADWEGWADLEGRLGLRS